MRGWVLGKDVQKRSAIAGSDESKLQRCDRSCDRTSNLTSEDFSTSIAKICEGVRVEGETSLERRFSIHFAVPGWLRLRLSQRTRIAPRAESKGAV